MFKKIATMLAGIFGAFLGGMLFKNALNKSKENSNIKKVIKKYNKIDEEKEPVDGDSLLLSGISSKSPEKVKREKKN